MLYCHGSWICVLILCSSMGWTRSLCLSALPSTWRAIRTVTGVARLHCLYLAGVSVMRCQIVVSLVFLISLCQSSRSGGCSRLVTFQCIPWRVRTVFSARAGNSARPGLLHLHCRWDLHLHGRWYLHLHCVLESASALPAHLHIHCILECSK